MIKNIKILKSKIPPSIYYKASKKIKSYKKKSGEEPKKVSAEIEQEKPAGETAIIRTIKMMKEELREWVESLRA